MLLKKFVVIIVTVSSLFFINTPSQAQAQSPCTTTVPRNGDIQAAINVAIPGSTICLESGIHTRQTQLNLNKSGTATQPITIRSTNPSNPAILDCTNCSLSQYQSLLSITGSHIVIDGITFQNVGNYSNLFKQNGVDESNKAITAVNGSNLQLKNIKIDTVVGICILFENFSNAIVSDSELRACVLENTENVKAAHPDWNWDWGSGISIKNSDGIKLNKLTLSEIWGEGIMYWAGSRNGIVENSNVTTVLGPYIYIDRSKNITARNNKLNVVRMSNNRIGRPFEVVNENNAVDAKFDRFDRVQIYNNLVIGNGSRITYCVSVGDFDNDPANNRYPITLAGTLLVANNTCINTGGFYTEPALAGTFRFENNLLLDSAGLSIKDGTVMKNNAWNTVANVSGNGNLTNIDPQLSNWTTVQRFPILDLRPYKIASSNSPLINTGTPQAFTSDILGCPHQGAPDIGAFEYNPDCTQMPPTPTPSPETSPIIKPGDIVKNNCVDIFDYNALISNFGKKPGDAGYNTAANLDADPVITIFDYSILLQNFESSCVQTGNV